MSLRHTLKYLILKDAFKEEQDFSEMLCSSSLTVPCTTTVFILRPDDECFVSGKKVTLQKYKTAKTGEDSKERIKKYVL